MQLAASAGYAAVLAVVSGPPLAGLAAAVPAQGRPRPAPGWWYGAPNPAWRTTALTAMGVLLAGLVGARVPASPMAPAGWVLAILAAPLATIDLTRHRLPDLFVAPIAAAGLAGAAISWPVTGTPARLIACLLAGLAALVLFGLPAIAAPRRAGAGDAKLAASLAMLAAWYSWTMLLAAAAYTALLAGAGTGLLLVTRRISRHSPVPFGPALIAGTLLAILAAGPIAT